MADLGAVVRRDWGRWSYREALVELVGLGWTPCGVGDWAVALRSPEGWLAARVCPFDPAYAAFLELCRRCRGNPYVPRVELDVALAGSGSLAVLEFLGPAPEDAAVELRRQWVQGEGDAELAAVRAVALEVDAEFRARVPWWDGVDVNPGNVRLGADGQLVLLDVFCMDGAALYGQVLADATVVRERFPDAGLLDIPYLGRASSPADLRALRTAWAG